MNLRDILKLPDRQEEPWTTRASRRLQGVATHAPAHLQAIKDKGRYLRVKILEQMDITQPTLSHHVKQLCAAGLVSCRKDGRWMRYSANRETAAVLSDWISG